jgi:hypothetical protein
MPDSEGEDGPAHVVGGHNNQVEKLLHANETAFSG